MMTAAAKAAVDVARVVFKDDLECTQLLAIMNDALRQVSGAKLHMTCFAAILDPATRTMTFSNAAHDFPYLVRHDGTQAALSSLVTQGTRLGEAIGAKFEAKTVALLPGDGIIWYTDGLIEDDNLGRQAGAKRLREILRSSPTRPPALRDAS